MKIHLSFATALIFVILMNQNTRADDSLSISNEIDVTYFNASVLSKGTFIRLMTGNGIAVGISVTFDEYPLCKPYVGFIRTTNSPVNIKNLGSVLSETIELKGAENPLSECGPIFNSTSILIPVYIDLVNGGYAKVLRFRLWDQKLHNYLVEVQNQNVTLSEIFL